MAIRPTFNVKYLERFRRLAEEGAGAYKLTGRRLLIEPLEMGELKSEGLILAAKEGAYKNSITAGQAHVGVVLLLGEDARLSDVTEYEVKPGDVVLVSEFGVRPYSSFPGLLSYTDGALELTSVDEIHMIFPGLEAYAKAIEILNRA